ncbi:ATP-binding cassette domain-containing protein [Cupriavidus sp. AU9028]|nr:ATP-binding cassette domain-containing protein [Cupriavidus sp. AU9028]
MALPEYRRSGAPLLEADRLAIHAGNALLLQPVSFSVRAGEALTLLGESGAGKSLLAQAVMGTLPDGLRASGRLACAGRASDAGDAAARRPLWGRCVALLPQEPWFALDPLMRVGSQLAESWRLVGGKPRDESWRAALAALRQMGVEHAAPALPGTLSGGMAQRVAFAMVRAGGAPVLIVDEPTKGLDHRWRDAVVEHLREALAHGCAVVTITHDIAVARALGGQAMVLQEGKVVEQGSTATVLSAPSHPYTRELVAADPAAWAGTVAASPPAAPEGGTAGRAIIGASGLAKRFGEQILFTGLTMQIRSGEHVAVTGPSGSGKSTLGNILLGLVRADEGHVHRADAVPRHRFQKLYQDPGAAFAPRRRIGDGLQDLIRLHRLDGARLGPMMEQLGLAPALLRRLPGAVSGGELQRFALLRALLLQPVFLFADEPTSRLDPVTQKRTIELIVQACDETGAALMLVTHDPDIASHIAGHDPRRMLAF